MRCWTLPLLLASCCGLASAQDSDGDGLSDLLEVHTYCTDPQRADSDGDGTPDGDWQERREFTYTVRSVVHVMKPVTPEYLNDDYQDARVLDETAEYVELEVIHYPFNTVADGMVLFLPAQPTRLSRLRNADLSVPQVGFDQQVLSSPRNYQMLVFPDFKNTKRLTFLFFNV